MVGDAIGALRFDGRVAIVTGAGRGIGRAYARLLAERGASVVINDILPEDDPTGSAEQAAHEIRSVGGAAVACRASVADEAGAQEIIDRAIDAFGRVDILVNNAGILESEPFPEAALSSYQRHFQVHALGAIMLTTAAWPHLVAQGYGKIVNTSSSAVAGASGFPYAVAKGAVLAFTLSLADTARPLGIAVNCVMPNAARAHAATLASFPEHVKEMRRTHYPPEGAAAPVVWLCHEDCDISGTIVSVGGFRAGQVFLAETRGYFTPGLTIEDVRDHWADVEDPTGYQVLVDGPTQALFSVQVVTEELAKREN